MHALSRYRHRRPLPGGGATVFVVARRAALLAIVRRWGIIDTMKQVIIEVRGTQRYAGGQEETITLLTAGRHYEKNGTDYFIYRETALSGMEGTTTTLKVRADEVILVRTGTVEARQVFVLGRPHYSTYITPFGDMAIGVMPVRVDVTRHATGTTIYIEYELEIGGEWQSTNSLSIAVREEREYGHQE